MHVTTVSTRNRDAECRRCGRRFKEGEELYVAGKPNAHKYYCVDCEKVVHIEVK